jgi:X-linked retinitis pigmentosa GTPase regulator
LFYQRLFMLWLNPSTGDVAEAPNRPSAAWVIIVESIIDGQPIESTLEGLRRILLSNDTIGVRPEEVQWEGKTGLNVLNGEIEWKKLIEDSKFPYITMEIASDDVLEIRYDKNSKDSADIKQGLSLDTRLDDDETPLKRGGQRGTGKGGQGGQPGGGGEGGQGSGDGEGQGEGEGDSDSQGESGEGEGQGEGEGEGESDSDGEGEGQSDGEGRDAYQEGQDSADSVSDKLKEKMKERMEGKGKPADESGEANQPAPDGSEGGAPAENPTGEGGQGTGQDGAPSQGDGGQGDGDSQGGQGQGDGGEGQGDGDGDGDGDGQGDGDGDGDSDGDSDGGDEGDSSESGEEGSQEGDSDSDNEGGDSSEKDSNEGTADSNQDENGEKGDESGDSSEKGDSNDDSSSTDSDSDSDNEGGDSGEDGDGESDSPSLPPEDEEALNQLVEEAEDARDSAEQSMQEANTEEAKNSADEARKAADEAREIVEENGQDADEHEKVQKAEEYADEAEEFADLAEELEDEINQLFDESGLDEDEFEEFKQGLLDELFGDDSEFSDAISEKEKRLLEKIERRSKTNRGTIRCVNWETGAIKSFSENEEIGDTWIQITKFFSPFETEDGAQIVVDRTIAGAYKMAQDLKIVGMMNKEEARFNTDDADFVQALKKMRMFQVRVSNGETIITY